MLCRDIIKLKIRTQENLTPYPGKIYLPSTLYAPRRAKTASKTEQAKDRSIEDKENMPNWGSPILEKGATVSHLTKFTVNFQNLYNHYVLLLLPALQAPQLLKQCIRQYIRLPFQGAGRAAPIPIEFSAHVGITQEVFRLLRW